MRQVQVGDLVLLSTPDANAYFVIDSLNPLIIADLDDPSNRGRIINENGQWKIEGLTQDHTLSFIDAEKLEESFRKAKEREPIAALEWVEA